MFGSIPERNWPTTDAIIFVRRILVRLRSLSAVKARR